MAVYQNVFTGTTVIATGLPEPKTGYADALEPTRTGKPRKLRRRTTQIEMIPVDPRMLENCAILNPEEHQEIAPQEPSRYQLVLEAFIDAEDTPGLYPFLKEIDDAGMRHSVDLMVWLRRWRLA